MSKQLINTLLKVCQVPDGDYAAGVQLKAFCADYNIGKLSGRKISFSAEDVEAIRSYLRVTHGIDPDMGSLTSFKEMKRYETVKHSPDEKNTSRPVRKDRVAIKSMPGLPLYVNGAELMLPAGSHLDICQEDIHVGHQHTSILLVENWESFEYIHKTSLLQQQIHDNPLVVFRGEPNLYNQKATMALLDSLDLPVDAFVDFDPQGLIIASSLPRFRTMIVPDYAELKARLASAKNEDRFIKQKSEAPGALERLPYEQLQQLWVLFNTYGTALPQEAFIDE